MFLLSVHAACTTIGIILGVIITFYHALNQDFFFLLLCLFASAQSQRTTTLVVTTATCTIGLLTQASTLPQSLWGLIINLQACRSSTNDVTNDKDALGLKVASEHVVLWLCTLVLFSGVIRPIPFLSIPTAASHTPSHTVAHSLPVNLPSTITVLTSIVSMAIVPMSSTTTFNPSS